MNSYIALLLFSFQFTFASDGADCGKNDLCDSGFCCDWGTCKSVDSHGGDSTGACSHQKQVGMTILISIGALVGCCCLIAAIYYACVGELPVTETETVYELRVGKYDKCNLDLEGDWITSDGSSLSVESNTITFNSSGNEYTINEAPTSMFIGDEFWKAKSTSSEATINRQVQIVQVEWINQMTRESIVWFRRILYRGKPIHWKFISEFEPNRRYEVLISRAVFSSPSVTSTNGLVTSLQKGEAIQLLDWCTLSGDECWVKLSHAHGYIKAADKQQMYIQVLNKEVENSLLPAYDDTQPVHILKHLSVKDSECSDAPPAYEAVV